MFWFVDLISMNDIYRRQLPRYGVCNCAWYWTGVMDGAAAGKIRPSICPRAITRRMT